MGRNLLQVKSIWIENSYKQIFMHHTRTLWYSCDPNIRTMLKEGSDVIMDVNQFLAQPQVHSLFFGMVEDVPKSHVIGEVMIIKCIGTADGMVSRSLAAMS